MEWSVWAYIALLFRSLLHFHGLLLMCGFLVFYHLFLFFGIHLRVSQFNFLSMHVYSDTPNHHNAPELSTKSLNNNS